MKALKNKGVLLIPIVLILAAVVVVVLQSAEPKVSVVTGMVETKEIDVAS